MQRSVALAVFGSLCFALAMTSCIDVERGEKVECQLGALVPCECDDGASGEAPCITTPEGPGLGTCTCSGGGGDTAPDATETDAPTDSDDSADADVDAATDLDAMADVDPDADALADLDAAAPDDGVLDDAADQAAELPDDDAETGPELPPDVGDAGGPELPPADAVPDGGGCGVVGTPCDDGDPCTELDACQADGSCAGEPKVCDDGIGCTLDFCNPATGNCVVDTGECECVDDSICGDGDPCTDDACNLASGECTHVFHAGNSCHDGDPCTDDDTCIANGKKCKGVPKDCGDGDVCTDDTCSPDGTCAHTDNTAPCDDGNACTDGDLCASGVCGGSAVDCDDGDVCTDDSCHAASGCQHVANTAPCDDGYICTDPDACDGGLCTGPPADCDDTNPCTSDSCDPVAGCVHVDNTSTCDDGDPCTLDDVCGDGACGGSPKGCDDDDVCTDNGCDSATGDCVYTPNTAACDDGDPCTTSDVCAGGGCSGVAKDCSDDDICTDDLCDPATGGCTHPLAPDGGDCGNGVPECFEQCDDGPTGNSDTTPDACRTDCNLPSCGDGVIDYLTSVPEQCDPGPQDPNGGCDASCQILPPPNCGDGVVDYADGEQCDDANAGNGDGCTAACLREKPPHCGDGTLDLAEGEQCDDGNFSGADSCSPTCQLETVGATCGNGDVEGFEACDDDNVVNGDTCNPTCNLENLTSGVFAGTLGVLGHAEGGPGVGQIGGSGQLAAAADGQYLFFSDEYNSVVRRIKVAPGQADDGELDTFVGVLSPGWGNPPALPVGSGVGDNPYDNADGSLAQFEGMDSLTTDGATLWVCSSQLIRAIDLTDPQRPVTTIAGHIGGSACADGVVGVDKVDLVDTRGCTYWQGAIYLLDATCSTLRRFDLTTHELTTLAGVDGQAGTLDGHGEAGPGPPYGLFTSPRYLTTDGSGVFYVADTDAGGIRSYNTVTDWVGTLAGDGTCGYVDDVGPLARLVRPRGLTTDGTSVYWCEQHEHTVRQGVLATGAVSTVAGQHCDGASCSTTCAGGFAAGTGTAAQFNLPFAILYHHPSRALYVSDSNNYVVRRIQ